MKHNKMRYACTHSLHIGMPKFKAERKEEIILATSDNVITFKYLFQLERYEK